MFMLAENRSAFPNEPCLACPLDGVSVPAWLVACCDILALRLAAFHARRKFSKSQLGMPWYANMPS